MSLTTLDRMVILRAAPFAWVHTITADTVTATWRFDNLKSASIKAPKPSNVSSNEYVEVTRGDGAVIKYTKAVVEIDGTDESAISNTENATGFGEITIETNQAPLLGSADYTTESMKTWTEFLQEVQTALAGDTLFLVVVPTGLTYEGGQAATTKKADGYAYMLGKLSNDLESTLNESPASLTLTFASEKTTLIDADDLEGDLSLWTAIKWKKGGAATDTFTPPDLASADDDADDILDGKILLKKDATYTASA